MPSTSATAYLTRQQTRRHYRHTLVSDRILKKLRIFGIPVVARLPGKRVSKLDANTASGIFLGYKATIIVYIIKTMPQKNKGGYSRLLWWSGIYKPTKLPYNSTMAAIVTSDISRTKDTIVEELPQDEQTNCSLTDTIDKENGLIVKQLRKSHSTYQVYRGSHWVWFVQHRWGHHCTSNMDEGIKKSFSAPTTRHILSDMVQEWAVDKAWHWSQGGYYRQRLHRRCHHSTV